KVISRLGGPRRASLTFLEIPNVHAMQQSFATLMSACSGREDDPAWLVNLHNSRWLDFVGALLSGASDVAEYLEAGDPVLVHCSDGWDRTSQLTALAQLLLDPYYRTIDGFQVLVSKDWCSFGHRFAVRGGHGRQGAAESSPIFPQFLDATYQLLRQFPASFEFSENLLLLLLHAYHSRRDIFFLRHGVSPPVFAWFNDFLQDSEYERALAHARSSRAAPIGNGNNGNNGDRTVSVWSQVRSRRELYENLLWAGGGGAEAPRPQQQQQQRPLSRAADGEARGGAEQGGSGVLRATASGGGGSGGCGGVDRSGEGGGGCCGGKCGAVDDDDENVEAGGHRPRHWRVPFSWRRKKEIENERLPPPLWPACGVRSLAVWRSAWASRGLQV
ncbi:unnamed protein product, partial [Ectocarpus sp. 4 AP-2014]